MGNGLYFMNCHNDQGVERSGIAFYDDIGDNNLNVNEQPKAFVYTDLVGDTVWESQQQQRATFSSNVTVVWQINLDAQSQNFEAAVGTATNGFQDFTVKKDDLRFVFRNDDGFDCFTVYFAN